MTHFFALGVEVALVMAVGGNDDRYALDDFEPVPFEPRDLARIVRHQTELTDPEIDQHLRTFSVVAKIRSKTERHVRLDRVEPLLLLLVRMQLVRQPDATPLLSHVENSPAAFLLDHLHRRVELGTAIAALGPEDIARETFGMNPDQRRLPVPHITLDERKMLEPRDATAVHAQLEVAVIGRQVHLFDELDELVVLATIRDEVRNRSVRCRGRPR